MEIRSAAPRIPDHDVLRCIGKGSYGEVWLARSVTGALRAVKVVRREDFELDRTFEREFEGIMKFDPISRDHPGLVHVLHVGRNDEEKFYYYVMELADDRERGSRADPADYEARTMGTDKATRHRLTVDECVEHGAQLAEGLAHLHEHGLTHRDIKPSNIIFVNGKAKLADIGLVAAAGQMTFVGTEGFVPPEGPGTKLADVYSLGMVLYEMSTGKDRLQFPELPDDLGEARLRPQWRALNDVILTACANQPKKRFPGAMEMARALREASRSRVAKRGLIARLLMVPVITGAAAFLVVTWRHNGAMPWPPGRFVDKTGNSPLPPVSTGTVRLESVPANAEVYYNGKSVGRTPVVVNEVMPGEAVFLLKRKRHRDEVVRVPGVTAGVLSEPATVKLMFDNPPAAGQEWENSLGMIFDPRGVDHISRRAVDAPAFGKVLPISGDVVPETTPDGGQLYMMRVQPQDAARFCDELTQREISQGYLKENQYYRPEVYQTAAHIRDVVLKDETKKDNILFRAVVERYGSLTVTSEPPGAIVYEGRTRLGQAPFTDPRRKTGNFKLRFEMPGYSPQVITGTITSGGVSPVNGHLEKSQLAVFGKDWRNSLGVPFKAPSPDSPILVSAWEVRVRDFEEYAKASGINPRNNDLGQTGDHPAVNVTREEARSFCKWLTGKERQAGLLDAGMEYRLPTDVEWSLMAGSPNLDEKKKTPAARQYSVTGVYPWMPHYEWPPPPPLPGDENGRKPRRMAANLGDIAALEAGAIKGLTADQEYEIRALGYNDGVVYTAPAGSFEPNGIGIFDMSGNVWEFVDDDYGSTETDTGKEKYAVLRGGAWNSAASNRDELSTHYRFAVSPDKYDRATGFRVVVGKVVPKRP